MSTARSPSHFTTRDYATWSGDWELHAGEAVAMTPSPFGRHGELVSRMAAILWNAIDKAGCHATVLAEVDWIVSPDAAVRPDLSVVCGPAPEGHLTEPPAMIVEILSAATRDRDLSFKRSLYAAHGVARYLTLDADVPDRPAATLRHHATPASPSPSTTAFNAPQTPTAPTTIKLCPACTITMDFDCLEPHRPSKAKPT